MTSQDELRDRIAATLYCNRHPREPMWGALAMARGEGMDTERGQTNCVQRLYVPMAQAIIDEFELTTETHAATHSKRTMTRIISAWEWEKQ